MSTTPDPPLSAKEKLKKAVKDYGATVIVFHVTISLLSLGGCYVLVSRYVSLISLHVSYIITSFHSHSFYLLVQLIISFYSIEIKEQRADTNSTSILL